MSIREPLNAQNTTVPEQAFRGMLWATAVGDAWGYPTEFLSRRKIMRWYGESGPPFPLTPKVSDDTQMTLALAEALAESSDLEDIDDHICRRFLEWMEDPDNNRSPGKTCMGSLRRLKNHTAGFPWWNTTISDSKGSGAIMRIGPVGFIERLGVRVGAAATQAAITHGHPTAVVTAAVTAQTIHRVASERTLNALPSHAFWDASDIFHQLFPQRIDGLSRLAPRSPHGGDLEEYLRFGKSQVVTALTRTVRAEDHYQPGDDPCDHIGQGWVAEEALGLALFCINESEKHHPGDPFAALRMAASLNGDSDTVGAIVGAILGSAHGPEPYREIGTSIEPRYRKWLDSVKPPGL